YILRRSPHSSLFPYTTLFRSGGHHFQRFNVVKHIEDRIGQIQTHEIAIGIHLFHFSPEVANVVFAFSSRLPRKSGGSEIVDEQEDRKSTRLNSSHQIISYAVF